MAEGVPHEEVIMQDDLHYGRLVQSLWQAGEGFILVEHDIAPWPGALQQMIDCPEPCCAYEYPTERVMRNALGCVKFDASVLRNNFSQSWHTIPWHQLDGAILPRLLMWYGVGRHFHTPAVAHARALRMDLDCFHTRCHRAGRSLCAS